MGLFSGGGFLSSVLNTAVSAIPGVGSYIGGQETNASNQQIAQDANQFNSAQAVENRAFQERMSNTANQREADDLEKAGLNRIIALGGGASTPSGGAAQATTIPKQNAALNSDKLLASALDTRRLKQDIDQSEGQIALTKAQEKTQETQQKLNSSSAKTTEATMQKLNQEKNLLDMQVQREGTKLNYDIDNGNLKKQSDLESKQLDVEKKNAEFSDKYNTLDNVLNRAGTATGAVRNATSIIRGGR